VDLERAKVCCADSVKKSARWMRDNGFRDLLWELRKQERDAGMPGKNMVANSNPRPLGRF